MLKINVTKKDDAMTVSVERVKFIEMPYWTKTYEQIDMLQKQVYSIADNSLYKAKANEDGIVVPEDFANPIKSKVWNSKTEKWENDKED